MCSASSGRARKLGLEFLDAMRGELAVGIRMEIGVGEDVAGRGAHGEIRAFI